MQKVEKYILQNLNAQLIKMLIISNLRYHEASYNKNQQLKKLFHVKFVLKEISKLYKNIGRIDRVGVYGHLNIVLCKNCSHKFVNPRFIDDFYIKYYLKKYRKIAFGFLKPTRKYLNIQKKGVEEYLIFIDHI